MTVALLPPIGGAGFDSRVLLEPLLEGPSFIAKRHPQRAGWLWHRPRSGHLSLAEYRYEVWTIWHLWCGQSANGRHAEVAEELPEGGRVCATCDGRAAGAGQIPGPGYPTSFTPRDSVPPRWCPGSGRSGLWSEHGPMAGRCGVCGIVAGIRWMGGRYNGDVGIVRHEPLGDLLEVRCPFHGWRQLVLVAGRAVCRCTLP